MSTLLSFFFPREIGRLSFFLRAVATEVGLLWLTMAFLDLPGGESDTGAALGLGAGWLVLFLYRAFWVLLPRIRDLDLPSWTLVLTLIPVISGFFALRLLFSFGNRFQRYARANEGAEPDSESSPKANPESSDTIS